MTTTTRKRHTSASICTKSSTKKRSNFSAFGPDLPKWPPGPPTVPVIPHDPSIPATRYSVPNPIVSIGTKTECQVFVTLYSTHREFVRRTVERHGVPPRDADDITQEVFAVALSRIRDFDAARAARPWLFVIAIQRAANYRRLARNRREPLSAVVPDEPISEFPDSEAEIVASEERALVRELIGRLSPKLRTILIMHDLEERPMEDIMAELQIPLKTAQARLKLAREEVLRRGHALALSQNAIPLGSNDLLRVREELLSYRKTPVPPQQDVHPGKTEPAAPVTYFVFAA
jgi:RNA polymerase sigma factor (sigma-70 family)